MTGKGKAEQKKLLASLEQLLQCMQAPNCPSYTAKAVLRALPEVNGEVRREGPESDSHLRRPCNCDIL